MTSNGLASRDDFLKPIEPNWWEGDIDGIGKVRLLELSPTDRTDYFSWASPNGKLDKERAKVDLEKLVTMSVVNGENNKLLTEEDMDIVKTYPDRTKRQLLFVINHLNGWDSQSLAEEKGRLLKK